MICRDVNNNLSAYLTGELKPQLNKKVEEHLKVCESCSTELSEIERLYKRLDGLETVEPSPDFARAFWNKVREVEGAEKEGWFDRLGWIIRWEVALSTALILIILIAGYNFWEISKVTKTETASNASPDIVKITKDIDFYRNYEIIKEMDTLIKLEEKDLPSEGKAIKNQKNHLM